MNKKITLLIFGVGFVSLFLYSDVSAINTQINVSWKPIGGVNGIDLSACSVQYQGILNSDRSRCLYCPSNRYHLGKTGSGQDICQLEFTSLQPHQSCSGRFSQPEKDQFGHDICVETAGTAGAQTETQIGAGQDIKKYELSVKIPGMSGTGVTGIAQYVAQIYQFSLMVVGLVALASLILGAVKYILSAGSIVSQEDARDQIKAAIYGLLILLGAYLILYTINPDLVTLKNPDSGVLNSVQPIPGATGATPEKQNALTPTQTPPTGTTGGTTANQNASTPTQTPATPATPAGQQPAAPGTRYPTQTQAPAAPTGQQPAARGARYPTQTGCTNNSSTYRVVINGVDYWACYSCGQFDVEAGICTNRPH